MMVITMRKVSLTDYIRWFSDNHAIESLDNDWNGVVIAPIGDDFIIRLGGVKE